MLLAPRSRLWSGVALLVWTGVASPVLRAASLPAARPWLVAVVAGSGAAAMFVSRRSDWRLRLLGAAVCAAALLPYQGRQIALLASLGLLLGAWVGLGARPLPFLPVPGRDSIAPVAVLTAVSMWQSTKPGATWQPFLPLVLAAALPLLGSLGDGALHRAAARLGHGVGRAVSSAAFTVLGLLGVILPWSLRRPLGVDPLGSPQGWATRERRPLQPLRPWAEDPSPTLHPSATRTRSIAAVLVIGVLVAGGVTWQQRAHEAAPPSAELLLGDEPPAGPEMGDWFDELQEDMAWVLDERVAFRPFEVYRVWDVQTRHVNVRDGERKTWRAPECDCDRVSLWLYGGSAVFGFEQRDDHTIASHLAKLAAADGIVLDVHNRGSPGQLHWRNAFRFSWDLTWEPAPDLVLFYDGADEVDAALDLSDRELGDIRAPFEPFAERLYEEVFEVPEVLNPPDGVDYLGWPILSDLPTDDPGRLASVRYERHRQLSADTAAIADVPVHWFWQPTRHTTSPDAPGDPDRARAFTRAADLLPPAVHNLSGILDGVPDPLFTDDVHHGERGAELVAAAIYAELRDDLVSLLAERGGR